MKCRYLLYLAVICLMVAALAGCNEPEPLDKNESANNISTASQSGPVECDWQLEIHDTVETNLNGGILVYTLDIDGVKDGGTSDQGVYKGSMRMKLDHKLPPEIIGKNYKEFQEDDVVFELIPYKSDEYAEYGLEKGMDPLPLLLECDSMCLKEQTLKGRWYYDIVDAEYPEITVSKDEPTTAVIKIKMAVNGGKVQADMVLPFQTVSGFKGLVSGTPNRQ